MISNYKPENISVEAYKLAIICNETQQFGSEVLFANIYPSNMDPNTGSYKNKHFQNE
jgi:hypothetical protein